MCRSSPATKRRKVNGSLRASKNIGKSRRTFPVEELAAVFPRKGDTPGKFAHELDDLGDVVVVLGIPGPRRWIEKIVSASQQLEELEARYEYDHVETA